jgi:hypothetical protein
MGTERGRVGGLLVLVWIRHVGDDGGKAGARLISPPNARTGRGLNGACGSGTYQALNAAQCQPRGGANVL